MEGMEFCCVAPFALAGLFLWTGAWINRKISGRLYFSVVAALAFVFAVPTAWLIYYSEVHEGIVGAAGEGDVRRMKTLIRWGADPRAEESEFGYPLVIAVENGKADAVKFLLAQGANPNLHNSDEREPRSLVRIAADDKRWDIVKMLKNAGGLP